MSETRICVECYELGESIDAKQGTWTMFVIITSVIGPLIIILPMLEWLIFLPLRIMGHCGIRLSPWRRWFPQKKRNVVLCPFCGAIDSMENQDGEGGKYALYMKKALESEKIT